MFCVNVDSSLLVFIVFFFKQKTAYEIYQCDWSSDVCSSDLSSLAKLRLFRISEFLGAAFVTGVVAMIARLFAL